MADANGTSQMNPGDSLPAGSSIWSPGLQFEFRVQAGNDGNCVEYSGTQVGASGPVVTLWSTNVQGKAPSGKASGTLYMQTDGNLVFYEAGDVTPIWASGTKVPGSYFVLQADGNAVIYAPSNGGALWATGVSISTDSSLQSLQKDLTSIGLLKGGTGTSWQQGNLAKLNQAQQASYAAACGAFTAWAESEFGAGATVNTVLQPAGWNKSRIGANVLAGGNIGFQPPTANMGTLTWTIGQVAFFDMDLQGIATDQDTIAAFKTQLEQWAATTAAGAPYAGLWPAGTAAKWLSQYNSSQSIGDQIGKTLGPVEIAAGAVVDVFSFGTVGTGLITAGVATTVTNNFGGPGVVDPARTWVPTPPTTTAPTGGAGTGTAPGAALPPDQLLPQGVSPAVVALGGAGALLLIVLLVLV